MRAETVLRWIARVWGTAFAALLAVFLFGGRESLRPTGYEVVGLLCFPGGLVIGYALAWWRDGVGAAVALSSLVLLHLWLFARDGRLATSPYFLVFAGPAALHLVVAWLAGRFAEATASARLRPQQLK
jgi:hypothetical protein